MGLSTPTSNPRTLTEALRAMTRDQLIQLLRERPDLTYPLPRDLSELAAQAGTAASVRRAVERLNAWQRSALEALAVAADPTGLSGLTDWLAEPAAEQPEARGELVVATVAQLRGRALLWGPDEALRLVRAVADYFGPYPAGLAPASPRPLSEAEIEAAMAACGPTVRPVLTRLLWGPPTGAVQQADRPVTPDQASTPVERLLAHRLLRPLASDTVILPREVAWYLRREASGSRLSREPVGPQPPALTGRERAAAMIDRAATGAAMGVLHDLDVLVQALGAASVQLLRDGRLAARDLTTLSRRLGAEADYATFVIELAAAADLISGRPGLRLLPTATYDRWLTEPAPRRWRAVVEAWLSSDRYFSAAAADGAHPLGPEAESGRARETRSLILRTAAVAAVGTTLDLDQLAERLRWERPAMARPAKLLNQVVEWTWQECGWLGLTALGATTTFWSVLAAGRPLPAALQRLFPEPIEQVIIQSDLTAVAPGPLDHVVAADLRLMADEESRGGGGVYRFSPTSLRRAFDAGWIAGDLHGWLEQHSSTPVPQPLAYLVDDVARQHGSIRVGPAEAVLRIDDLAQQAALLAHPDAVALRLRVLAPGVVAAGAAPEDVVALLHRIGLTPIAEDATGQALVRRPPERAPSSRKPEPPAVLDPETAADAVLGADRRRRTDSGEVNGDVHHTGPDGGAHSTEQALASLTEAALQRRPVRVSYVTTDGTHTERLLGSVRLIPGLVRATDARTEESVTIPLARISAVRALRD